MTRIVKKEAIEPLEIKPQKESVWICMCGLSKNHPFCDSSHKSCTGEKEEKLYEYENGKRIEVK